MPNATPTPEQQFVEEWIIIADLHETGETAEGESIRHMGSLAAKAVGRGRPRDSVRAQGVIRQWGSVATMRGCVNLLRGAESTRHNFQNDVMHEARLEAEAMEAARKGALNA